MFGPSSAVGPVRTLLGALGVAGMLAASSAGWSHAAEADAYLDPRGAAGSLVLVGGGTIPEDAIEFFTQEAGGEDGKLVVIPTASGAAGEADDERWLAPWKDAPFASVTILHRQGDDDVESDAFVAPLVEATAVWFGGGQQSRIADAYLGTRVEREIEAVLARGGVVGGTSAGAAIQVRLMIAGGRRQAEVAVGLDLLPGVVVDQHFRERNRRRRLLGVIREHPDHVGLGIDEGTALLVSGRRLAVVGEGGVTVVIAAGAGKRPMEVVMEEGDGADLTALRRAARDRVSSPFPPAEMTPPRVEHGTLMIVGGGGMTDEMIERFIELAGGPDGHIVVLPTAMPDPLPPDHRFAAMFVEAGARNVHVLRARTREEVESPESLALLQQATGLWFGGGRQWRFVDAYENTLAVPAFHDVLARGGVIGGSSAGASIQAEYMVRGNPLGNWDMMAAGYERGFGFLPGAAVDQHFAQRNRFDGLASVIERYPQVLGLGIDESTALVVQGSTVEVIGEHAVHVIDRHTIGRELPPMPEADRPDGDDRDGDGDGDETPDGQDEDDEDPSPPPDPRFDVYPSGSRFDFLDREPK